MNLPWKARRGASARRRSRERGRRHPVLRAVVCVAVLALLCIPPVFTNSAIGYVPALTMLFLVALSYGYLRLLASRLQFGVLSSRKSCPRNTASKFLVRFKSRLPLTYTRVDAVFRVSTSFGTDDVLKRFSFSLAPFKSRDFEFGVRFAHVGTIEVGLSQVVLHDPLGLFTRALPVAPPSTVEVTPRIYPVDEDIVRLLELSESMESPIPISRDGMDYMGVREYQLGDPMKAIHWKLSSRTGDLYTRLYETSGNPGVDVLCDLYCRPLPEQTLMFVYDALMELGLSLHHFGLVHSIRVDLLFYDEAGECCRFGDLTEIDHRELIRRMPLPSPQRDEDEMAQLVSELTLNTAACANMIVCVSTIGERLATALLEAQGHGRKVVVFLVVPEQMDEEERAASTAPLRRLADEGVSCAVFSGSSQTQEVTLG